MMTNRGPALLIVALALLFVAMVLMRSGVFPPVHAVHAPAAADTLPAAPRDVTWLGGTPSARGSLTAIVVWNLADPGSLAAADRAEQWRLLYAPLGARVIGVYAPHAAFDTDSSVVMTEMKRRGLGFPVALDGALAWTHALSTGGDRPRVVLADTLGRVRWTGRDVRVAERELERMVAERRPDLASPGSRADSADTPATSADDASPDSASTAHAPVWLGAGDHPEGPLKDVTPGGSRFFHAELASEIAGTKWMPTPIGLWTPGADGLTAMHGGAAEYVALRYDASPLAVLAAAADRHTTRLWVLLDGASVPGNLAGADLRYDGSGQSYLEVTWPRLYDVVKPDGHVHVVNLSPESPNVTLYAFVFEAVPPVKSQP
jgi:hypothetical protein